MRPARQQLHARSVGLSGVDFALGDNDTIHQSNYRAGNPVPPRSQRHKKLFFFFPFGSWTTDATHPAHANMETDDKSKLPSQAKDLVDETIRPWKLPASIPANLPRKTIL